MADYGMGHEDAVHSTSPHRHGDSRKGWFERRPELDTCVRAHSYNRVDTCMDCGHHKGMDDDATGCSGYPLDDVAAAPGEQDIETRARAGIGDAAVDHLTEHFGIEPRIPLRE